MPLDIDSRRLGTDVALPEDPDDEISVTITGDIATVTGRSNLAAALRHRLVTPPGALTHRPDYGAGSLDFIESAGSPATRARMAGTIRRQVLQDPRLQDARVRVRQGDRAAGEDPAAAILTLSYRLRDDTQEEFSTALE